MRVSGKPRHIPGEGLCGTEGFSRLSDGGGLAFPTPSLPEAGRYRFRFRLRTGEGHGSSPLRMSIQGRSYDVPFDSDEHEHDHGWRRSKAVTVTLAPGAHVVGLVASEHTVGVEEAELEEVCAEESLAPGEGEHCARARRKDSARPRKLYDSGGGLVDVDTWIPMRWPCGPLELDRAKRRETFTAREADLLRAWTQPASLELVAGTPVTCLVVPWAEGSAADDEQQRAQASLIAAARRRGLSVVGWVGEKADLRRAAGVAQASGLSGLATTGTDEVPGVPGFDILRFRRRGFGSAPPSDFLGDVDAVWPGLRTMNLTSAADVDAVSGPTGTPWLDSNGWYVRLARRLAGPRTLWLAFEPPDVGQPHAAGSYVQAIADTEAHGARWLVSLDPHLRAGLLDGRASARDAWFAVRRTLAFFREHAGWASYVPVGQLGVVSDYRGPNEFLSFEVLNLLGRQGSLYRILEKGAAAEASLDGLDAIVYVDEALPAADLYRMLYAFSERGGTLVTPPGWEERGVPEDDPGLPRYRVYRHGRGRLAVARKAADDPQVLAEDAQLLMSHRLDRLRVYNVGAGLHQYATSGDGRSGVLHTLAFPTPYPKMPVTIWFRQAWAAGRYWTPDAADAPNVERAPVETGVEFRLPSLPVYSALGLSA